MSEKNLHIIHGNYVSKEMLLAYLRNELNDTEKIRIEKLIAEDEFLKDAVDGLKGADIKTIERILFIIYGKIDKITGVKKPFAISPSIKKYAAAASFIFFLGLTFFVMDRLNKDANKNSEIALQPKLNKEEIVTPADTTFIESDMGGGSMSVDSISPILMDEISTYDSKTEISRTEVVGETKDGKFDLAIAADFSVTQEIDLTEINTIVTESADVDLGYSNAGLANAKTEETKSAPTVSGKVTNETDDLTLEKIAIKEKKVKKNSDQDVTTASEPVTYEFYQMQEDVSGDSLARDVNNQLPQFPGGIDSLNAFLLKNITYPSANNDQNKDNVFKTENVYLKFLVNEDGSVSNAYILTGMNKEFDNEALRAVKLMPKWIPGKKDGVPVKVWYTLDVKF